MRRALLVTISVLAAMGPAPEGLCAASGQAVDDASRIRKAVAQGQVLSLPRILSVAQRSIRGDILKVELKEFAHQLAYEVKVLTPDGRVRQLEIEARTGRVLTAERD